MAVKQVLGKLTSVSGTLPVRQSDMWGSGVFGAARGGRAHKGIDIAAYPGTSIKSLAPGAVTKIGLPYADNPDTAFDESSFRYVQVTLGGVDYRYFYVAPSVAVGDWVWSGYEIGIAQDLTAKYPGMINHVHFSIKKDGVHLDPTELVFGRNRV